MDYIKLYSSTENQLVEITKITEQFTKDIKMEFGIDKCRINSTKAGKNHQHHVRAKNRRKNRTIK